LPTTEDAHGKSAYFSNFKGIEVMFHVPQLIGNDGAAKSLIAEDSTVLVFNEGSSPFTPAMLLAEKNSKKEKEVEEK
jgi:hypothetical protein